MHRLCRNVILYQFWCFPALNLYFVLRKWLELELKSNATLIYRIEKKTSIRGDHEIGAATTRWSNIITFLRPKSRFSAVVDFGRTTVGFLKKVLEADSLLENHYRL